MATFNWFWGLGLRAGQWPSTPTWIACPLRVLCPVCVWTPSPYWNVSSPGQELCFLWLAQLQQRAWPGRAGLSVHPLTWRVVGTALSTGSRHRVVPCPPPALPSSVRESPQGPGARWHRALPALPSGVRGRVESGWPVLPTCTPGGWSCCRPRRRRGRLGCGWPGPGTQGCRFTHCGGDTETQRRWSTQSHSQVGVRAAFLIPQPG